MNLLYKRRKTDQPPGEGETEHYRRSWQSYVIRRNLVVLLFLGFIAVGVATAKLHLGEGMDFVVLLGWIAVYLAGAWWLTEWHCPRCGKVFGHRLWTERCISCNLSKKEIEAVVQGK
jgi:hypothetical protein